MASNTKVNATKTAADSTTTEKVDAAKTDADSTTTEKVEVKQGRQVSERTLLVRNAIAKAVEMGDFSMGDISRAHEMRFQQVRQMCLAHAKANNLVMDRKSIGIWNMITEKEAAKKAKSTK
jgi:hypothetical protein